MDDRTTCSLVITLFYFLGLTIGASLASIIFYNMGKESAKKELRKELMK